MDAQNNPAASDKNTARWGLILLVLCAVGVGLVVGILVLQVTEYQFYKAAPGVWPQSGAGGTVSAPGPFIAPTTAITTPSAETNSAVPVTATVSAAPAETATSAIPVTEATTSTSPETATAAMPATTATATAQPELATAAEPVSVATAAAPSEAVASAGVTSIPAEAATSTTAPAATTP